MAHTYYTHAQAAMLLSIDDKTLNDWLRKAPADIAFQASPADRRVKVISRTKLSKLASLHGRTLPENDDILEADTRHAKSNAALTLKVEELEQQLGLLGGIFHQTVGELQGRIGDLNRRLSELEQSPPHTLPPEPPVQERLPEPAARRPPRIVASTVAPPRGRQSTGNPAENLCSVREFARLHGTTRDWLEPAITAKKLEAERRPYGKREQRLFTPAQQDAAVRWLDEEFPGVNHLCPFCPHDRQEEESGEHQQAQA